MAEQRSTPAGKDRGKATSLLGKAGVTYGVDPAMKAVQPACGDRPDNAVSGIAEWAGQLSDGDDPVLAFRQVREGHIRARLSFVAHTATKGNRAPVSPPWLRFPP
ncbi:MAG: hypothetical protein WBL45_04635, partial [Solirubrobacterales bacterium]